MKLTLISVLIASVLTLAAFSNATQMQGRLVVYYSATNEMYETEIKAFGEKYDMETSFTHNGSGSTLAKVDAEKKSPQTDMWCGGTLGPQSQAGEIGLLQPHRSPNLKQIMEEFRDPAKVKGNLSSAVYVGILGFGVDTQRLKEKNLPVSKCWRDLTKPGYKGEIQIADLRGSGVAYIALATFTQPWGRNQAFDYLRQLNANVSQCTKSGTAPARNVARGGTTIDVGFLHDCSLEKEQDVLLEPISPCEGTGYEVGGVNILKGAHNAGSAGLFIDWMLLKDAQRLVWKKGKSYQILVSITVKTSPNLLKLDDLKLINYDMDKYGFTDVRKTLISKWVSEVKMGK